MNRADLIQRLKSIEPQLRERGVGALYLFGSYARDEARPDSDVDLFIDPLDDAAFGLKPYTETYELVERTLPGIAVGYSTRDGIAASFRPGIERAAVRVF